MGYYVRFLALELPPEQPSDDGAGACALAAKDWLHKRVRSPKAPRLAHYDGRVGVLCELWAGFQM